MAKDEKVTPVTEEEIDNIRVTLDLDDGSVECRILTIFEADNQDYIALIPLDDKGNENADGCTDISRMKRDFHLLKILILRKNTKSLQTNSMKSLMTKCLTKCKGTTILVPFFRISLLFHLQTLILLCFYH